MTVENQEMAAQIKIRLAIDEGDTSKDAILQSYLSEVQEKVKSYCNRKTIPQKLEFTVIRMTVDLFGINNPDGRLVKSETQGSRTLQYAGNNDVDAVVAGYTAELNRFRRVRVI